MSSVDVEYIPKPRAARVTRVTVETIRSTRRYEYSLGSDRGYRSVAARVVRLTPREFRARLERRAKRAGVSLEGPLTENLWAYFTLLETWNKKINLTALTDADEAFDRLLVEPLVAAQHLPAGTLRLLDIGSGSGSPAIPMKLAAPSMELAMVESKTRKAAFLREAIRQLGLAGSRVENGRYEEMLTRPELHEALDVVTVRAVRTELRVLAALQAFLRPDGILFLFKGPSGPDATEAVTPLLRWEGTFPLVETLRSRLVILRKGRG